MTTVAIEHHGHTPAPIMPMHLLQKHLEIAGTLPPADSKQAMPSAYVHAPEYHAPRVRSAEHDWCGAATLRPHGAQRWKLQQVGFILDQNGTTLRQAAEQAQNLAFFSPAVGLVPVHTGAASSGIPYGASNGAV